MNRPSQEIGQQYSLPDRLMAIRRMALFPERKMLPPLSVSVSSGISTLVELLMQAYTYPLYQQLGIFIPLIVVNCIVLGRAEAFASKNRLAPAIADGVGMGLGFTLALFVLGAVRELFGSGTLFGYAAFGPEYQPLLLMILPPGAFIAMGLLLAAMNKFDAHRK